jgi:hypothetical protein
MWTLSCPRSRTQLPELESARIETVNDDCFWWGFLRGLRVKGENHDCTDSVIQQSETYPDVWWKGRSLLEVEA